MHTAITSKKDSLLSFAKVLPLIFSHFDINLEDEEKEKVVGRFDEKALKNFDISKDDRAWGKGKGCWTSNVMNFKPPSFTNEKFECLCQEVEKMPTKLGLLSMLVQARFKEQIKDFKHTLRLYIQN